MYPRLSRMAMDYLSIPGKPTPLILYMISEWVAATSVDVERIFSKGRILLSHVRNRLSVQSTRALMCLGSWSLQGYVKNKDIFAVTVLPEVMEEEELEEGWDAI
jgi:hypothetical protein